MSGPSFADLAVELKVMIFTDECLGYYDLFRFSWVNQEWRDIIWKTNDIRERMFLPRLPSTGTPAVLPSFANPNKGVVCINWVLPRRLRVESGELKDSDMQLTEVVIPPWSSVRIHPLLEESHSCEMTRYEGERQGTYLRVSYQLLKRLNKPHSINLSVVWRKMLITQPALKCLTLLWNEWSCGNRASYIKPTQKVLRNRRGITLGDVYDALWRTLLPRNAGLVPDHVLPADPRYDCFGSDCRCYLKTRATEEKHDKRMEDLEWEREKFEAKVIKKGGSSFEGTQSEDLVIQVSGKVKHAKIRVIVEMVDGELKTRVERHETW